MPKYIARIFPVILLTLFALHFAGPVLAADVTAPFTNMTRTPTSPDGNNGWYKSSITFYLTPTDIESGVKEVNYQINAGVWQKVTFSNTLNLIQNPSFEDGDSNQTGISGWDVTGVNPFATYFQDTTNYAPGFATASAKTTSSSISSLWAGINNQANFAVASPFDNMGASIWLKIQNVSGNAYFRVNEIRQDAFGAQTVVEIARSPVLSGTAGWTNLNINFTVTDTDAIGVFIDVGLEGSGTVWADAATITSSPTQPLVTFVAGEDTANGSVKFYSADNAGNVETYSCVAPVKNCVTFKMDQTPPGDWHDSGAFRGPTGPSDHHLYVYANVDDPTSGISILSNKYMYHTSKEPGFGVFDDLMRCSSNWQPNEWASLGPQSFSEGALTAYLLTPKTDFCDSDWKVCKTVLFYAEDVAGNSAQKSFCLNGPWISVRGEGVVRSNNNIDMLSEPAGENTDGLIEAAGSRVDFFTSTRDWVVKNYPTSVNYTYDDAYNHTKLKTSITGGNLPTTTGLYEANGNYIIDNQTLPAGFATQTFNQIIFISGDLTIKKNINVSNNSTALFIVKGNVNIDEKVDEVGVAIFADGDISTAYNVTEGNATSTLVLKGIYSAHKFNFQRTLQGTNNSDTPSEDFTYEPKYTVQLKTLFGGSTVKWEE